MVPTPATASDLLLSNCRKDVSALAESKLSRSCAKNKDLPGITQFTLLIAVQTFINYLHKFYNISFSKSKSVKRILEYIRRSDLESLSLVIM